MSGKIFVGNTSNIATLPKNILVGNPNNIARNVKGIYVGNSQNQAVKVWPNGRVPEGYQEVEYIRSVYQNNGFVTNITPDSNTRIVIDFMYTEIDFSQIANYNGVYTMRVAAPFYTPSYNVYYSQNFFHGYSAFIYAYTDSNNSWNFSFRICFGYTETNPSPDWVELYNWNSYSTSFPDNSIIMARIGNEILNKRMTIDLNRNRGTLYVDNVLIHTFTYTFSSTDDIVLLAYNPVKVPQYSDHDAMRNKINLYNCQIYKNNVLVRDFIPCYNKTTYDVYLYDIINNNFYQCTNTANYPPYLGPDV